MSILINLKLNSFYNFGSYKIDSEASANLRDILYFIYLRRLDKHYEQNTTQLKCETDGGRVSN